MRANGATFSWTSAHSIEKLLLPLSVMTVGDAEPTQRIWSRRPPISTSFPVGDGGAVVSCADSATGNAESRTAKRRRFTGVYGTGCRRARRRSAERRVGKGWRVDEPAHEHTRRDARWREDG